MQSLKVRLIVAFSLITIIPLAVAMALLTVRIQSMVRKQAAERLETALGGMRDRVASEGRQIAAKLEILGRDPGLKRLYLLQPALRRELQDHLGERQILLGLDFLGVQDTSGNVVSMASARDERISLPTSDSIPWNTPRIVALEGVATLALATRSPILYQGQPSGFALGGVLFDASFLNQLGKAGGIDLVLRDPAGRVAGATFTPTGQSALPRTTEVVRTQREGRAYWSRTIPLEVGNPPYATITGLASTEAADRTIASLQIVSALLGLLGLGIAIALAVVASAQISRPVVELASFSEKLARGEWDEPLALHSVRELESLVRALDRMRLDLKEYRRKLLTSERQAAWSQMARKVAHEVKNPLTPIAISIEDLKRSYEQKRPDFPEILNQAVRTVSEEVETLRRLLQEFADFARIPPPRLERCTITPVLEGLEALYGREVEAGKLVVIRPSRDVAFTADPGQLKQALLNLVKNGLEALNGNGRVEVSAAEREGSLELHVSDTGPGLSEEQKRNLFAPGFTTKAHGSGLGLTIVERIVSDHQGTIAVDSAPGRGTTFRIRLPLAGQRAPQAKESST